MLPSSLSQQLTQQIGLELYSANLYRHAASVAFAQGLDATYDYLRKHMTEEQSHASKIADYLDSRGALVVLVDVEQVPVLEWQSVPRAVLEHEERVTDSLSKLQALAENVNCRVTREFLDSMLSEQVEEERNARQLVRWHEAGADLLTFDAQVKANLS